MRFHRWSEVPEEKLTDLISRKIISGEKDMAAQVFARTRVSRSHTYSREPSSSLCQAAALPSEGAGSPHPLNMEHRAVALEDTLDLDIFSPFRDDWLTG